MYCEYGRECVKVCHVVVRVLFHAYLLECVLLHVMIGDVVLRELSALFVCGYGMSDCV